MHFPSFAATALLLLSGIAPTLSAPVPATSCKPKRESAGKGKPNLLSDIFPSPTSTETDDVPTAMTTGASHTKSSHASVTTGKASATASFDAPEPSASASTSPSSGNRARFVLYTDSSVSTKNGLPSPSDIKGYNVLALSFLLASGPADQAQQWVSLSASERESALQAYHDAGIKLIVSAFGETETPTTSGTDAAATAQKMAAWVKKYNLDGIDVDYEDFKAFESQPDKAIQWLVTFTKTLRQELPAGQYTISHAPVAPWFTKDSYKGGYLTVDQKAGDDIDWYNVQFYNQGEDMYTECTGLLNKAGSSFPGTSLFEIADAGIPLDKLVIGKPGAASQASNGFLSQATLASCVSKAQDKGWNGGVMTWEYPSGKASFISAVRGSVFPL